MPVSILHKPEKIKHWMGCLTNLYVSYKGVMRYYSFGGTLEESVNFVNMLKNKYKNHTIKVISRSF